MPRPNSSFRRLKSALKALAELGVILELAAAASALAPCPAPMSCNQPPAALAAFAPWPIVF